MANLISSSRDDRTPDRIEQRDPDKAIRELHDCIVAMNATVEALAKMFPGVTAMAGIDHGQPLAALAYATSTESCHLTFEAMANAQRLAKIVASLPDDLLQEAFRIELSTAQEIKRLLAQAEEARAAALAAAEKPATD
jgi:hypothetical protein